MCIRDSNQLIGILEEVLGREVARQYRPGRAFDVPVSILDNSLARRELGWEPRVSLREGMARTCLLYTSDAADERSRVDLGGRRIIKKKNKHEEHRDTEAHTEQIDRTR